MRYNLKWHVAIIVSFLVICAAVTAVSYLGSKSHPTIVEVEGRLYTCDTPSQVSSYVVGCRPIVVSSGAR